jgi:restriction system protein
MKFKLAEKSIFALLLRSPWWISFAVALAISAAGLALLPTEFRWAGPLGSLSFVVVGSIAAWRQFKAPSSTHVAATLAQLAAMSWRDFSAAVALAYSREGFEVQHLSGLKGASADFELHDKLGRITLVSAKRWKAARQGLDVLQSFAAACRARSADGSIFITLGGVTEQAKQYAAAQHIRLLQGAELAQWLRPVLAAAKA